MVPRSSALGKSTKKISSNRPFRISSGGSADRSFAVATTNTSSFFSCSHVRNAPNIRKPTPPSASPPEVELKPFSISSSQSTEGAMVSAIAIARRKFFSVSPTYLS